MKTKRDLCKIHQYVYMYVVCYFFSTTNFGTQLQKTVIKSSQRYKHE